MRGQPPEPAPEGAPVRVDGVDADAFGAEKGAVDEDEAEARLQGSMREERTELVAEDGRIGAAAVEAEDTW